MNKHYIGAFIAIGVTLFVIFNKQKTETPIFPPFPFSGFQCNYQGGELKLCERIAEPKLSDMQKWGAEEKNLSGIITPLRFFIVPLETIKEQKQLSGRFSPDTKLEITFYNGKALWLKESLGWNDQNHWFGKKNKFGFHNFFHQAYDKQDNSILYKNFQIYQTGFYFGAMDYFFDPKHETIYQMQAANEQSDMIPYAFSGDWILLKNQKPYQYFSFSNEQFFALGGENEELYFIKTNSEVEKYELYYGKRLLTGFISRPTRRDNPPYYYLKKQYDGTFALYTNFEKHNSYPEERISDFQPYIDKIAPLIYKQKKLIEDYIFALDTKNYAGAYAMLYQPPLSLQAFKEQQEALQLKMQVLQWKIKTEVPLFTLKKGKIGPTNTENENAYRIRTYNLTNSRLVSLVDYDIQIFDGKLQLKENWKYSPESALESVDFNKKARLAHNYIYFIKTARFQEAYDLLKNPKSDFSTFVKNHKNRENVFVSEYVPEQVKIDKQGAWEQGNKNIFSDYFSLIISYEENGERHFRRYSGKQIGEQIKILEEREIDFSCTWLCNQF